MRPLSDTTILTDESPPAFLAQGTNPLDVLGPAGETVSKMDDGIGLIFRQFPDSTHKPRGHMLIEQKFHAASFIS